MNITAAERRDLPALLELQYLAYQSEAALSNDFSIPPLQETLEELQAQFDQGHTFLKAENEQGTIIGSIRGHLENGTLFIGKLMVHPNHRNKGKGTRLLSELQALFPRMRCELFTSDKSQKNLELYMRNGFIPFRERQIRPGLKFIYLEKNPVR